MNGLRFQICRWPAAQCSFSKTPDLPFGTSHRYCGATFFHAKPAARAVPLTSRTLSLAPFGAGSVVAYRIVFVRARPIALLPGPNLGLFRVAKKVD